MSTSGDIAVADAEYSHQCNRGSETPDYVDPVAGVALLGGRTTVNVSTAAQLTAALADAVAGQTIQLAAGTYSGNFSLTKTVAANNPIIVRGAPNFASIATGAWSITGARQIVTGIDFDGEGARVSLLGINNKWVGNKFRNWTNGSGITIGDTPNQTGNEIAYNEIGPGGPVPVGGFRWGVKGSSDSTEASVAKNVWIHHNRFRDFTSQEAGRTAGRSDVLEPGETGKSSWVNTIVSGWYIEDNLFTNCQDGGQAALDMKYGGAVIRRNTVAPDSASVRLQIRFGANSVLESNYMAVGILQANGRGHKIVCNYGTIRVNAGESEWNVLDNTHHRSLDTLVAKNTGSLVVGHAPSGYTYPAQNTTIEDHTGSISFGLETGTHDNRTSPSSYDMYASGSAYYR